MPTLTSARKNYAQSALLTERAVREAKRARKGGVGSVARVVATHQLINARTSEAAVSEMLREQDIDAPAAAPLNLLTYTSDLATINRDLEQVEVDWQFNRLVASLVQDAGRAAESVSTASRNVAHVRYVNPPCCSRCAILAGRVYRWSDGFRRHPGCDCTMIPTTVASPLRQDPEQLVRDGLVTGLSKADRQALSDGADLGQVVNVRSRKSGLLEAGHSLTRGGRPTPAGIYRLASDQDQAVELLTRYGYLR